MQPSDWKSFEAEWTNAIVDSINWLRERRRLTVSELAARLRSGGWSISDATAAGILSGRKRASLSIAEVFAFARALQVAPSYLILGLPVASHLPANADLWSGEAPHVTLAAGWLRGYGEIPWPYQWDETEGQAQAALEVVTFYSNAANAVSWQAALLHVWQQQGDAGGIAEERASLAKRRLSGAVAQMLIAHEDNADLGDAGAELPPIPRPLEGLSNDDVDRWIDNASSDDLLALAGDRVPAARSMVSREIQRADRAGTS